ncbi:MAG: hypothetical protein K0R54_219 [Clostridiaceae bacterium]|jgi:hypothetical protein|nr:hypothetical protein [Clostridiaceae bacterium]
MKGILFTVKELMEIEDYKQAEKIKFVDKDNNEIITKEPILLAPVLFFEMQKNNTMFVKLWICNEMPEGWKIKVGITSAPNGFYWIYNGKNMFDTEYKLALLKVNTNN